MSSQDLSQPIQLSRESSVHNNSFILLNGEDSMSNLELERSVDRLLPHSAQASTSSSQKEEQPPKEQIQQGNQQPQPVQQQEAHDIFKHEKKIFGSFLKADEAKSSLRLYAEILGCGFFSKIWRNLGKMNEEKGHKIRNELKQIKNSINDLKDKTKEVSLNQFKSTPVGDDVLIYGKASSYIPPMNEASGFNTKAGYCQLQIQIQTPYYKNSDVQVTLLNGKQFGAGDVTVVRNQKNGNSRVALASAALFSGSAAEWLSLKFDSDFSIERDEFVFVLGKRLYNQGIIPTFIFKNFDLSKYTIPVKALAVKSIIFKALLAVTTVICLKKVYTICKRQFNNEK